MPEPAPVLLDTHVWIWGQQGDARELGTGARNAIDEAEKTREILISAISVWEVAMLVGKGRVQLSSELSEWVQRGLSAPGARLMELSPEIAIESTRLPGDPHGDPSDRILIATARRVGATLLTRDRKILAYAAEGFLSALDAGE